MAGNEPMSLVAAAQSFCHLAIVAGTLIEKSLWSIKAGGFLTASQHSSLDPSNKPFLVFAP